MDGKRFVFDLQRFTEVSVTETTSGGSKTYTVGTDESAKTITESNGSFTYNSQTYNSLEDAVAAADPSIKFTVTTKDSSNNETTKYYDAADDFNKDNNLKDATAINVYGNVTLQDDITNDDKVTCTITVKKTATLNTNGKTLTFGSDVKNGITIADSTDSNKIVFTVNGGGKIIGTSDPIGEATDKISAAKGARYPTTALISVGTYNDSTGDAKGTKLIVNGVTIESNNTAICGTNKSEIEIAGNSTIQSYMSCGIYLGNKGSGGQKLTVKDTATIATGVKLENLESNKSINGVQITKKKNSNLPAIQVAGNYEKNNSTEIQVTIQDNAKIEFNNNETDLLTNGKTDNEKEYLGNTTAIYIGGYAKLTIEDNVQVTSAATGVEMRSGELEVKDNVSITSTAENYSVRPNSSGSTVFGAAIAISQHTTKQAIKTTISDNVAATGAVALAIENPQGNKVEEGDTDTTIGAKIKGGTFTSNDESAAAIALSNGDSRVQVEVENATFVGSLVTKNESTSGEEAKESPQIHVSGTITVVDPVTKEETTYDNDSVTFTEPGQTEGYIVEPDTWVKAKAKGVQNTFYYVQRTTAGTGSGEEASSVAEARATLAPATETASREEGTGSTSTTSKTKLQLSIDSSLALTNGAPLVLDLTDATFADLPSGFNSLSVTDDAQSKHKLNITGNANIKEITGGENDDTLTAGSLGSALNGGTGADLLIGGSGPDTFLFSAVGNGSDSIQDYTYGTDVVSLGSGIAPATSFDKVSYAGKDYVVSLGGNAGDSLTFKSTGRFVLNFGTNGKDTVSYTENSIVSGEGVTIGSSYYKSKTFNGNSGDNAVFKTIDGSAVVHAIRITGNSNANLITGSKYGGTLLGGDADDTLVATSVGTYLNGGAEADSLVGFNGGGNVFIYTGGDDKIKNYTTEDNNKAQDLVSVASGINVTSATVTTTGTSDTDLVLDFGDGDKLTFESGGGSTISLKSGKKYYTFSASSIASASDKSITLTAGYNGTGVFNENGTYDNIDASLVNKGAISIKGNGEANYIIGGSSGGSLSGLAGNDTLVGGAGNDIFHYTEGKDVIVGFNESADSLSIDNPDTQIAKAKTSSRKLTFTMNNKANTLVFRATDAAPTLISLSSNEGYLTKDGVVSLPGTGTNKSLKLFSSAKGRIDLNNDSLYSGKGITSVSAADVTKQSVTLVGGSTGGTFTFATNNKKRDGFEYNGGKVTINKYESGKDRLNLGDFTISGFKVTGTGTNPGDVVISLGSGAQNVISLTGAAGSEMLIHQSTNRGNSYSKMVFDETGVVYDKAKTKATSATIWSGMTAGEGYDATAATKLKKIKVRDEAVTGISIQAGGNNTLIDASLAGAGVSLYSGDKNDKFIGSSEADMFVYTKGKDIIQGFGDGDSISLKGTGDELKLENAKITSGKKSIKFKFEGSNKNTLTIKPTKNATLSGALHIDNTDYTYGKNFIAKDGNVSLTSQFGGTYNLDKVNKNASGSYNYVDGHLVEKKLTIKGTDAAESLIGGSGKTMFKGGGGPNSGAAADTLVGGSGKDTFFYAKGDKGNVTIANFDFDNDKLKIAGGTINKIESLDGGIQFAMKNGRGDSPAVGWFKVTSSATSSNYDSNGKATSTGTDIAAKDVLIKANNTYYWFAQSTVTLASDSLQSAKVGDLITWDKKVSKSDIGSGAAVIELNYSTNLVKAGVASVVSSSNALPNKS